MSIRRIKMCNAYNKQYDTEFISVMPTNLYGPNDNFHPDNSHVIPALLRRFHEAKVSNATAVTAWGTGSPFREFLHVNDMAAASIFVMNLDKSIYAANTEPMLSHINVGTGEDMTIKELAQTISDVVGYEGEIKWDSSKPNGTPRKVLNVDKIKSLGWEPKIGLREGIEKTYEWYKKNAI